MIFKIVDLVGWRTYLLDKITLLTRIQSRPVKQNLLHARVQHGLFVVLGATKLVTPRISTGAIIQSVIQTIINDSVVHLSYKCI